MTTTLQAATENVTTTAAAVAEHRAQLDAVRTTIDVERGELARLDALPSVKQADVVAQENAKRRVRELEAQKVDIEGELDGAKRREHQARAELTKAQKAEQLARYHEAQAALRDFARATLDHVGELFAALDQVTPAGTHNNTWRASGATETLLQRLAAGLEREGLAAVATARRERWDAEDAKRPRAPDMPLKSRVELQQEAREAMHRKDGPPKPAHPDTPEYLQAVARGTDATQAREMSGGPVGRIVKSLRNAVGV